MINIVLFSVVVIAGHTGTLPTIVSFIIMTNARQLFINMFSERKSEREHNLSELGFTSKQDTVTS